MDKDLKEKTLAELEQIVVMLGQKKYLAGYIFSFIHDKGIGEISQITPLSKALRAQLTEQSYFISQLKILRKLTDPDGTIKYLFELSDGNRIETVLLFDSPLRINRRERRERKEEIEIKNSATSASSAVKMNGMGGSNISRGKGRKTLCVSTQVGCAMNCAFCATAKVKLRRNLTAAEIVDQVNTVQKDESHWGHPTVGRISNIVYMGMGEPLLNYDAVVKSIRILNDPAGKNIGIRHITVSTCGVVPAIKKLAEEDIHPRLAVSLNAPADALRAKLMPVGAKYSIADLIEAAKFYRLKAKQRVTFEYVLMKGVNDTVLHAQMLARLLRSVKCRVNPPHAWRINLIEFNPHPGCEFVASGRERIERFAGALEEAGIKTTVRFKMGQSIKAACGQLGAGW
ncbi:MAG: 23S rRNA (adenine(2503)-C(2))-methyltransferase RlmN [Planctomycetota bacterium]|nr:23S rRNA (adenine(2503)-C(2))-methyltransferase RlmN [Planctomycetota bacterium]